MSSNIQRTQGVTKKATKLEGVLEAFCNGEQLHRFIAGKVRDTCLNSTVSSLVNSYGLQIDRRRITVDRQGDLVPVKLYWLAPASQQEAERLLKLMKSRRTVTTGG